MRLTQTLATAGLAIAVSAGLMTVTSAPAAAAASVPNPSFSGGWTDGKLTCWNVNPALAARFTVTGKAHSAPWAAFAEGKTAATTRLELTSDRTDACKVPVTAGLGYMLRLWQRSTAGAAPVVYTFSATAGWKRWFTAPAWRAADLRSYAVAVPKIPAGVTHVSVGLSFPGNGTVVLDDVSLTPINPPATPTTPPTTSPTTPPATSPTTPPATTPPAPIPTVPPASGALFQSTFPTTDRLVTNEYAYWNATNPARVVSPDWEMTSGSLFARGGNGYTGKIDAKSPNALSTTGTNSAVFRLNTRNHSYGDVAVSFNLNVASQTTTSYTPAVAWDGVHIFLRYQSQFELYYASVARRDGAVLVKKKCKGGPSNGGSYYVIGNQASGKKIVLNSWMQVGASVRNNPNGSVSIVLYQNGTPVVTATDTGVGCAPLTHAGATGIRGDNSEFDFNNFTVKPLA